MDFDRLSSLVLEHLDTALQLAVAALDLVDAPEQNRSLKALQDIDELRGRLEVSTVALLLERGASWEALASELGVTRQSLNRRLHKKTFEFARRAEIAPQFTRRTVGGRERVKGTDLEAVWRRLLADLAGNLVELGETTPREFAHEVTRVLRGEDIP